MTSSKVTSSWAQEYYTWNLNHFVRLVAILNAHKIIIRTQITLTISAKLNNLLLFCCDSLPYLNQLNIPS